MIGPNRVAGQHHALQNQKGPVGQQKPVFECARLALVRVAHQDARGWIGDGQLPFSACGKPPHRLGRAILPRSPAGSTPPEWNGRPAFSKLKSLPPPRTGPFRRADAGHRPAAFFARPPESAERRRPAAIAALAPLDRQDRRSEPAAAIPATPSAPHCRRPTRRSSPLDNDRTGRNSSPPPAENNDRR